MTRWSLNTQNWLDEMGLFNFLKLDIPSPSLTSLGSKFQRAGAAWVHGILSWIMTCIQGGKVLGFAAFYLICATLSGLVYADDLRYGNIHVNQELTCCSLVIGQLNLTPRFLIYNLVTNDVITSRIHGFWLEIVFTSSDWISLGWL